MPTFYDFYNSILICFRHFRSLERPSTSSASSVRLSIIFEEFSSDDDVNDDDDDVDGNLFSRRADAKNVRKSTSIDSTDKSLDMILIGEEQVWSLPGF